MPKTKYKRKAPVKKKGHTYKGKGVGQSSSQKEFTQKAEKSRKKYEDMPKWEKDSHWHIRVKGKNYNVPKASEVGNALLSGVMGAIGKKGAKKAAKKKKKK